MKAAAVLLCAATLLLTACGDDASPTTGATTPTSQGTTSSTGATSLPGPEDCEYYDVAGCALYGLVLAEPLPTAAALDTAAGLPGVAIAVWRSDYVCVLQTTMGPPGGEVPTEPSRFAYVDAEGIRERRLQTSGTVAPPITGLHISASYWDRWEDQWAQAREAGVLIEAVAVYLPQALVAGGPPAGFSTVVPIASRRTDTLDPAVYAGELLVESEWFPEGYLGEPEPLACE